MTGRHGTRGVREQLYEGAEWNPGDSPGKLLSAFFIRILIVLRVETGAKKSSS